MDPQIPTTPPVPNDDLAVPPAPADPAQPVEPVTSPVEPVSPEPAVPAPEPEQQPFSAPEAPVDLAGEQPQAGQEPTDPAAMQ